MIKVIKIGELVFERIEPFIVDEKGNKVWNIPDSLEELKKCALDTIKWDAGLKLKKTDWVVTKIAEIQVTGGNVESVKEKYKEILKEREAIRTKSNELEDKINACKTYEELLEIVKDLRI